MQNVSNAYESKELATNRQPVELYHIWWEYRTYPWTWKSQSDLPEATQSLHYYYTSGDSSIVFGGNTYNPAVISRGSVQKTSQFEPTKVEITTVLVNPVVEYLTTQPVDIIWVSIARVFLDQAPMEAALIFLGQINDVKFKGQTALIECLGFEYALGRPIPKNRYQPTCNWQLFDENCQVNPDNYIYTGTVTYVDNCTVMVDTGIISWVTGKGGSNGYCKFGMLTFNEIERRMIVEQDNNTLTIRYPIKNLSIGSTVKIFAGCDGTTTTCRTKFNNLVRCMNFAFIPYDNPATWIGR